MGFFSKKNKVDPKAVTIPLWIPPLQRHVDQEGKTLFYTLSVKLYAGNVEQDYKFKFPSGKTLKPQVCLDAIADRLDVPKALRSMFGLWVVGREVGEIQVIRFI